MPQAQGLYSAAPQCHSPRGPCCDDTNIVTRRRHRRLCTHKHVYMYIGPGVWRHHRELPDGLTARLCGMSQAHITQMCIHMRLVRTVAITLYNGRKARASTSHDASRQLHELNARRIRFHVVVAEVCQYHGLHYFREQDHDWPQT